MPNSNREKTNQEMVPRSKKNAENGSLGSLRVHTYKLLLVLIFATLLHELNLEIFSAVQEESAITPGHSRRQYVHRQGYTELALPVRAALLHRNDRVEGKHGLQFGNCR